MNKSIFVLACSLMFTTAHACDVCGCSGTGSMYSTILPRFNSSFLGMRMYYRSFTSTHPESLITGNDYYTSTEIWGRWNASKKWQIMAQLPYHYFHRNESGKPTTTQGIGDVSVVASYTLLNTVSKEGNGLKQTLQLGAGIKLPSGSTTKTYNDLLVSKTMQTGSGSTDYILNGAYTIRKNKLGASAQAMYKLNGENGDGYRYGNQFNSSVQLFYWKNAKRVTLLPSTGLQFENVGINTNNSKTVALTGGHTLLYTIGAEVYYKNLALGIGTQLPVSENSNDGLLQSHARCTAHITIIL